MPSTPRILGQVNPAAAFFTTLYTAPALTYAIVSTLGACDQGTGLYTNIDIAVRPAGAGLGLQHYIAYDLRIGYNDVIAITGGITLEPTDVISVWTTLGPNQVIFFATGIEITSPTDTPKVLGQAAPAAAAWTTIYTVPALTNTVVSSIIVCNRSTASDYITMRVRPAGAAALMLHNITPNALYLGGNTMLTLTWGIGLEATDIVQVWSTNGTSSFSLFGQEIA